MKYKYYILENKNKHVQGVISDTDGVIIYEDLMIKKQINNVSYNEETVLEKYDGSPIRSCNAELLVDNFDDITIEKDYWKALHHAGGPKRKAIALNSEC